MFIIAIDLCIPENWNWFPWVYVNKLRNDRIFKTLLRFEKSHESIDFDLAKYVLVLQRKLLFKFVWKFQISKLRWVNLEANLAAAS